MHRRAFIVVFTLATLVAGISAQEQPRRRPPSPEGTASAQVDGQWIDITYGRPLLRGRSGIFGTGADYGKKLNDGGPVWRAGANLTTLLRTEVALEIGGTRVPAGEHAILIDLKGPKDWTFILSDQAYQRKYDPKNTTELYGGFNYKPDSDVTRATMTVEMLPYTVEQLTWGFTDVTASGGTMRIWWDRNLASVPFKIVK